MTRTLMVFGTQERARYKFREWQAALRPALTRIRQAPMELVIGDHTIQFMNANSQAYRGMELYDVICDELVPEEVRHELATRVRR